VIVLTLQISILLAVSEPRLPAQARGYDQGPILIQHGAVIK
jgi:hypothetical protein